MPTATSSTIQVSATVKVEEGPTTVPTKSLEVDAFDRVQVVIPKGGTATNVEVQPASSGKLLFLLIQSSEYSPDKLIYSVTGDGTEIKLDSPHIFMGAGAISLLPATPNKLTFKNTLTDDVTVTILAGREAIA